MPTAMPWTPASGPAQAWSVLAIDAHTGEHLIDVGADRLLRTASVGKLLLLRLVAQRIEEQPALAHAVLDKASTLPVADSGLWQHLEATRLPVVDHAALVAAVSDNLCTNALLDFVGLENVQQASGAWMPGGSQLLDHVRDERGPTDPETLSVGTARDYVGFLQWVVHSGTPEARRLARWMSLSADTSLVAGALGVDPLAHFSETGERFLNKTGCDTGIRADVGVLFGTTRQVIYAAICNGATDTGAQAAQRAVADLRELGASLAHAARA